MTEREALEEIKNRLKYFCGKTDGTYSPPWVKEIVEIAEDGLKNVKSGMGVKFKELIELKGEEPKHRARRKSKKVGTMYRAKSCDSKVWLSYTYGTIAGNPIEASTMAKLASSIAYYYYRHAVDLYVSEDGGEKFKKADKQKQLEFSHVMDDEFRLDEWH